MIPRPTDEQYSVDLQTLFPYKLTEPPPSGIFARILEEPSLRHGLEFLLFTTKANLTALSKKELNAYEQWLSLYRDLYRQIRDNITHPIDTKKLGDEHFDGIKAT